MSENAGEARLTITAEASGATASLTALEGKSETTAKKVSAGFSSEFNKVSSAAGAMSGAVGGAFGQIGSLANSALKPLTEVSGSLGIIGAAAVGVMFAGRAVFALADGASAAADRLRKVGVEISPEAASDISRYNSATKDLGISFDKLEVAVGGPIAGELATLADATSTVIGRFISWRASMEPARLAFESWAHPIQNFVSLGILDELTGQVEHLAAANRKSAEDSIGALLGLPAGSLNLPVEQRKQLIDELDRLQTASSTKYAAYLAKLRAADAQLVQQEKARVAAGVQLEAVYDSANRALLTPQQQIQADLDKQLDQIAKLGDASGNYELAWKAAQAATDVATNKLHDYDVAFQSSVDTAVTAADDALRQIEKSMEDYHRALVLGSLDAGSQIIGSIQDIAQATADRFQSEIDAGEHLSYYQVQAANKALNAAESAAILAAGVQASTIAITGIASLQALGIPPWIAVPVGLAEGAGAFLAAVQGIEAHKPMQFTWDGLGGGSTGGGPQTEGFDPVTGQGIGKAPNGGVDTSGATDRSRRGRGTHVTVGVDSRTKRLTFQVGRLGQRDVR